MAFRVWITVLACRFLYFAETRMGTLPVTLFGTIPCAIACPALSVITVRVRLPFAKRPLAPLSGRRNVTAAPATGLWFSSST